MRANNLILENDIYLKMKILIVIFSIFSIPAIAQFPDTAYIFTYGGVSYDHSREIQSTNDGGYILVGSTGSFGNGSSDIYLLKIDSACSLQWSKAIGGNEVEWGYSVKQTFDNGFIIAGYTNSYGAGGYDVYLVKTDSLGDTVWTKSYGGEDWDLGYSVQQTSDSGFVICGETYSFGSGNTDVYVIKTNKTGDTTWTRTIGGINKDMGYSIIITNDSNYVIVGETSSFGLDSSDVYLIKLNKNGDTMWTKTYGGNGIDVGYNLDNTSDNGLILIGSTNSFTSGVGMEAYMIKTDSMGGTLWTQLHGTGFDITGSAIKQLPDDGFVIGGTSMSGGLGGKGLYIVKTNSIGGWQTSAIFGDVQDEEGYSITLGNTGEILFAGTTTSYGYGNEEIYLIKVDTLVASYTLEIDSTLDNLSPPPMMSIQSFKKTESIKVYPNPFKVSTSIIISQEILQRKNIRFLIFDLLGNKLFQINEINTSPLTVFKGALKPGIYIYTLAENETPLSSGKLIIY